MTDENEATVGQCRKEVRFCKMNTCRPWREGFHGFCFSCCSRLDHECASLTTKGENYNAAILAFRIVPCRHLTGHICPLYLLGWSRLQDFPSIPSIRGENSFDANQGDLVAAVGRAGADQQDGPTGHIIDSSRCGGKVRQERTAEMYGIKERVNARTICCFVLKRCKRQFFVVLDNAAHKESEAGRE
jgi:hypothetical protein